MKKIIVKVFSLLLLSISLLLISGCEPTTNSTTSMELPVEVESFLLLEGTPYETTYYIVDSKKEGPDIVIVGGIHGDETAGWNAALSLIRTIESKEGFIGRVLILPQANIMADLAETRFYGRQGVSNTPQYVNGIKYSDLNRAFSNGRYSNAAQSSITMAEAITKMVEDFDELYNVEYIVDLHEASKSYDDSRYDDTQLTLGNSLIYYNCTSTMRKIKNNYNNNYRLEGETKFINEDTNQKGSFNYYFTYAYPDKVVFTIETNRDFYKDNGTYSNHVALETRVRIQLNMLESLFDIAWGRI